MCSSRKTTDIQDSFEFTRVFFVGIAAALYQQALKQRKRAAKRAALL